MDFIFDIDGTLANAEHRLHLIQQTSSWKGSPLKPDWDTFLSDEMIAKDVPIEPMFCVLDGLIRAKHEVIFITGRPEAQRQTTIKWILDCSARLSGPSYRTLYHKFGLRAREIGERPILYMRNHSHRMKGQHPKSDLVKLQLLEDARRDGWDPKMVFEDRAHDAAMWRKAGLICAQVADGNY